LRKNKKPAGEISCRLFVLCLGYRYRLKFTDFNTAFTPQALIGMNGNGFPVLQLKNIYRTDLNTFFVTYALIRVHFHLEHKIILFLVRNLTPKGFKGPF
jgi:hypothetical protein